jgi:hypothetical protein
MVNPLHAHAVIEERYDIAINLVVKAFHSPSYNSSNEISMPNLEVSESLAAEEPQIFCPPEFQLEWPFDFNLQQVPPNVPQDPSIDPELTGFPEIFSEFPIIEQSFQDFLEGPNIPQCPTPWIVHRLWTAVDETGETAQCEQLIIFTDFDPPTLIPPGPYTLEWPSDFNFEPPPVNEPQHPAIHPDETGYPEAFDNCGVQDVFFFDVLIGPSITNCPFPWEVERHWVGVDFCGNQSEVVQIITFSDFSPPEIVCPPDVTLEWPWEFNFDPVGLGQPQDPSIEPSITGGADAVDNCGIPAITFQDELFGPFIDNCPDPWYVERTWIATDACGNETVCVQRITFTDTTLPEIVCPEDVTLEWISGFNTSPVEENQPQDPSIHPSVTGAADAVDNCGFPAIGYCDVLHGPFTGNCPEPWYVDRTWKAIDACGNVTSCVQRITFTDFSPPEIACPDDVTLEWTPDFNIAPVEEGQPQDPSIHPSITGAADAVDNCGIPAIAYCDSLHGPNPDDCPELWFVERKWKAIDACGNVSTCIQKITFTDTTPPEIECPDDLSLEWPADFNLGAVGEGVAQDPTVNPDVTGYASASDNCEIAELTFCDALNGPFIDNCPDLWNLERTWKARDACGLEVTCVQTITFKDTTPPEFEDFEEAVSYQCPEDVPAINDLAWTDNCDGDGESAGTEESDGQECPETITRTWTATDICGNETTATQVITVDDTEAPEFPDAPANTGYQCMAHVPALGMLTWTDNCDGTGQVMGTETVNGVCPTTIVRTWTYEDYCENETTVTQTITVNDTQDPIFAPAPFSIGVQCLADVPPAVQLGWTDNCDGAGMVMPTVSAVGFCPRIITRTWSYTDFCGNVGTATQTITVNDTQAPVFAAPPANVAVQCMADVPAAGQLAWTDNCDGVGQVMPADVGAGFCPRTITRTWSYTDFCGNVGTATQTITVDDTTNPFIGPAPVAISVQCPADVPVGAALGWADNCDGIGFSPAVDVSDNMTCPETITRTWSVSDFCNNMASVSQIIIVNDTIKPILTCPPNDTIEWPIDFNLIPVAIGLPQDSILHPDSIGSASASDNCTLALKTYQDSLHGPFSDECPYLWYVDRHWRAYDLCSNESTCTQRITFTDTTPPSLDCPAEIMVPSNSINGVTVTIDPEVEDNCDPNPIISLSLPLDYVYPCNSVTQVSVMATDVCGNVNSCDINIRVNCPGDVDGNGVVDVVDFLALNSDYGNVCVGCPSDLNGDGIVDINDFLLLNSNYGNNYSGLLLQNPQEALIEAVNELLRDGSDTIIHPELVAFMNEGLHKVDFHIIPNPNDGSRFALNFKGSIELGQLTMIIVSDISGREVFRYKADLSNERSAIVYPENRLDSGSYMLTLIIDGVPITKQMIIE